MMKKWNQLIISLMLLLNTGCLLQIILSEHKNRILVTLFFYLTIWIPKIIRHIFKIDFPPVMEMVYLLFLFFAHFLGSVVNLYETIYWFDSFAHFISGILTAFLSVAVLFWFHKYDPKSISFNIFFMIAFTLMVASLWEFSEFFTDLILHSDAQKVLETGVTDTMKDMILAFLGTSLVSVYYAYEKSSFKKQIFNRYEKELGVKI